MEILKCKLPGVRIIKPLLFQDDRGFFMESYNQEIFSRQGLTTAFVQDNHSLSVGKGVLRGLHYQLEPMAQSKLVRVTAGSILDVVVDIRKNSPSYGQWEAFELSAENKYQLLIPKGFAHGFCTLEFNTEVQYKVDAYYSPELDRGIAWDDPAIGIDWPVKQPILSDKDARHPLLEEAENNFYFEG